MSDTYFFIQPILASNGSWVALNWQSDPSTEVNCAEFLQCFSQSTAVPLAKNLPLVIPIAFEYLQRPEFLDTFEKSRTLFVLPSSCLEDESAIQHCCDFHRPGIRLAIQIDSPEILYKTPFAAFDTLRFSALTARQDFSALDIIYMNDVGFKKIATHVDSFEMFEWLALKRIGIEWSDGYFLTKPNLKLNKSPQPILNNLLRLFTLIKSDGDTQDIEAVFREEPKLSHNLLHLVNSVAMGGGTKINSFSQAVVILGRRQLQRWLQLLIYSSLGNDNAPNPLIQLAAARGRQMELLSAAIEPIPDIPELSDNAFIVGRLSLLDALVNLPMSEVLKEIPLQDEVANALVDSDRRRNVLGQLLSAVVASEAGDFAKAPQILSNFNISPEVHAKSQVTAYYWASRINTENSYG